MLRRSLDPVLNRLVSIDWALQYSVNLDNTNKYISNIKEPGKPIFLRLTDMIMQALKY